MINHHTKIIDLSTASKIIEQEKQKKKTVGLCHGVFDLVHIGHIKYLHSAKKLCDVLIVTITPDIFVNKGPSRPAFTENLRLEFLASLEMIDFVALNQWPTAIETLQLLQPSLYIKGPDYKDLSKDTTNNIQKEKDAIEKVGGQLVFTDDEIHSSSKLLLEYSQLYTQEQKLYFQKLREILTFEDISSYFAKLRDIKVLVVGESIIDSYCYCDALGKSGKEPVLNMRFLKQEDYLGGVLAIAKHLHGLGCKTEVLSLLGENREYEDFILENTKGISSHFFTKKNSPTIVKKRYVDAYSQAKLLGIYEIEDSYIEEEQEKVILSWMHTHLQNFDVILVADYGHGFLTPDIIKYLCEHAPYLALNTQINSANIGFHTISKYLKADFVCIHTGELHQDYRNKLETTEKLTIDLSKKLQTQRTCITMGKSGLLGYNTVSKTLEHCPAFASKIVDRVGAGDTVLSVTSILSYIQAPLILTLVAGNLAGAFAVSIEGNKQSIDSIFLLKSIKGLL